MIHSPSTQPLAPSAPPRRLTPLLTLLAALFLLPAALHAQVSASGDFTPSPFASPDWVVFALTIGNTGVGNLTISTGGTVESSFAFIGGSLGSTGLVEVSGGNWTNASLSVGASGNGTLKISNGTVASDETYIGASDGSTGVVEVSGGNLKDSAQFFVGQFGNGTLQISGTGSVVASSVDVAQRGGSRGVINIGDGTTAGILNTPTITGGDGSALLNFNHAQSAYFFTRDGSMSGGTIQITGTTTVNQVGTGRTILTSANTYTGGTNLEVGSLFIGNDDALGTGALAISGNTTLGADDTYSLANVVNILGNFSADVAFGEILELGGLTSLGNSTRTVTLLDDGLLCFSGEVTGNAGLTLVRGTGATLPLVSFCGPDSNTFTGTVNVGSNVELRLDKTPGQIAVAGNLTIQAGGRVQVFSGLDQISANSTVTVDGTLRFLNTTGSYVATFAALNGASTGLIEQLAPPAFLAIGAGDYAGKIDDTGNAALFLQKFGNGTLTLRGTTTIQGNTTVQGGTVALTGNASITHDGLNLIVGQSAGEFGTVTINGTASVSSNETFIGNDAGSRGLVQITGGNLTNTNRLFVGYSGNGTLELSGTARVASDTTFIGSSPSGNGTLQVSGGNLTNTNNLIVGNQGTGRLEISDGTVTNITGFIGSDAGSTGSASISGGTWTNTGDLRVGDVGTGTLNLVGGNVTATSITLANNAGSNGTLNFGIGTSVSTLTAASITGGAGNALVNFNHSGILGLTSALAGTLAVNHLGTGRTILSVANTYTGGTTVTSGTLQTNNTAALGTGPVTLNGGTLDPVGTLTINSLAWNGGSVASTVGSATDLLNVTGALTLAAGSGTFAFDAGEGFALDTPYTILSAANLTDAFLSLFTGNSLNGASPSFTRSGLDLIVTFLLGGALDGPLLQNAAPVNTSTDGIFTVNSFVQTGSPTNNNTIFGLIFNPNSLLQVFNTLTVTGGNVTVTGGNATLTGGTVFVPGNFNKNGVGNLDVQSLLQILGLANVNTGGLFVNGLLQANGLNILPDGTLGGAGTIFGNVANFGNVAPGNSPGTLSIIGNFAQASTGALNIELASLTNFDRLVVTGNANLAGTLNATSFGGFTPAYGQQFAFLQAGSITGSFDTITAPAEFRGRFLNNGTTGTLLLAPDTYTRVAETQNQRNVARALDAFIPVTTGDRATVSLALDLQTSAQYPGAFDQIAPTLHETIADITLEQAFTQTQLLNQRMSSVRLGARGFQAIGLNAEPLRHDKDGKSVADPKDLKAQVAAFEDPRWSTWVIGSGMFANIRGINQMPNLNFQSGGFLVGTDYAWSENLTTGLYGGYQGTSADYGDSGNARINSAIFGAYATYAAGGFYADAVIGGGYSNYKVNRSIEFSTIDRTAASQQNGGQFTSGLNLGYDWKASGFTFGPVLGAQYTLASISPFTETGAGALNLRVAQQNANSLRTTLGGRIAYNWNVSEKITIIPEVRAFWQHEFLENPRTIGASLNSGNGPGFNYTTAAPDRDAIFTAAGLTAQFGETWNASLYYNTSFANETTLIHTISASLGLSF